MTFTNIAGDTSPPYARPSRPMTEHFTSSASLSLSPFLSHVRLRSHVPSPKGKMSASADHEANSSASMERPTEYLANIDSPQLTDSWNNLKSLTTSLARNGRSCFALESENCVTRGVLPRVHVCLIGGSCF